MSGGIGTFLKNVTLPNIGGCRGGISDVSIRDGRIQRMANGLDEPEAKILDCTGLLLVPGLVNAHAHLDKTMWGAEDYENGIANAPQLSDLVENERAMRRAGVIEVRRSAPLLLGRMIALGTTALRTHIDVDDFVGMDGVEAVLEVRDAHRDRIDIETVAFPQSGILRSERTKNLLESALEMGVDAIGGLDPAQFDRDAVQHLDIVFRLAAEHGKKIDIHLHERSTLGLNTISLIAKRTAEYGLGGSVAVSHAFCLGDASGSAFDRIMDLLAESGVALVTSAPGDCEFAPHDEALRRGMNYALGTDNIRDAWSYLGNGDMLDRVRLLAERRYLRTAELIEDASTTATFEGARLLGLENYGIEPGCAADFFLVPSTRLADAVTQCPERRIVFKRGRIVTGADNVRYVD